MTWKSIIYFDDVDKLDIEIHKAIKELGQFEYLKECFVDWTKNSIRYKNGDPFGASLIHTMQYDY